MKTRFKKIIFLLMLVKLSVLQAQVTVTVNVQPPYSPYFSDYVNDPNKVYVTLTSSTPIDVYLRGSITSLGGVDIHTSPGYKPPVPIHLNTGVPYQLTLDEIQQLYDLDNVEFEGIDKESIVRSGQIPEDVYEICIKAYDYQTDVLVSNPDSCSASFVVTSVEPPAFISPVCGTEYVDEEPLVVPVSWTVPANVSPSSVYYHFRMVEIPLDAGITPEDALNDPAYPAVFERDYNTNSIVLTHNDVPFTKGNIYAYNVWVGSTNTQYFLNPPQDNHRYYYSNNGLSEACWFVYKENLHAENNPVSGSLNDFAQQFDYIPHTRISGRLLYKLPPEQQTMSLQTANPANGNGQNNPGAIQGYDYNDLTAMSLMYAGSANENANSYSGLFPGSSQPAAQGMLQPPFARGTIHARNVHPAGAQPLANTQVQLVVRLVLYDSPEDVMPEICLSPEGGIFGRGPLISPYAGPPLVDIDGNRVEDNGKTTYINMVLDVTTTDAQGNYSFDFQSDFFSAPCEIVQTSFGNAPNAGNNNPVQQVVNDKINAIINPSGIFQGASINADAIQNSQQQQQGMQTMSAHIHSSTAITKVGYICLKVEPVNQKFTVPDVDIFAMPGDQIQLGDEVVYLKTYRARVEVKSDNTKPQMNGTNRAFANAKVKILRREDELNNEHPVVLNEEGQKLHQKLIEDKINYKIVSKGITGQDGVLLIPNLVKHWYHTDHDSPYFLMVKSRKDSVENNYENTLYNYTGYLERLPTDDLNRVSNQFPPVMTSNYRIPTVPFKVALAPKAPEIKGRIMAKSNMETLPVANARVFLMTQADYSETYGDIKVEQITRTNEAGFFRFTDLPVTTDKNNTVRGPYRRILISVPGYKDTLINPYGEKPFNLNNGQLKDLHDIYLQPANVLKGYVIDEDGKPVEAYVSRVQPKLYYKTRRKLWLDKNGNTEAEIFDLPVNSQDSIVIEPLSSKYFKQTYPITQLPRKRQAFTVYKKLHRLRLTVTDKNTRLPVARASVVVGDSLAYGKTDGQGIFIARFATPDKQFVIKVGAEHYAPKQEIINLPVSQAPVDINLQMEAGFSISGIITDETTGKKVEGAKIFARLQNTDGHQLYVEAYTGAGGAYTLQGIPASQNVLTLHIVKEGNNPSYVGKKVTVQVDPFAYPKPSYDFTVKSMPGWDLTRLLGFPMQVEELRQSGNRIFISGYLHHLNTTNGFKTVQPDLKVPFYSVQVQKLSDGTLSPVHDYIDLDAFKIPVKIHRVFAGKLKGKISRSGNTTVFHNLKLQKDNDRYGHIADLVELDLESFRFAYGFDGSFYIGDALNSERATVFNSDKMQVYPAGKFVFDLDAQNRPVPVSGYTVFGFKADAQPAKSVLTNGKIKLASVLHTKIPLKNKYLDLKIPIGDIEISQNDIQIKKKPYDQLEFNLEKWQVSSQAQWYFDKNEEAIVLPKVFIHSHNGFTAEVRNLKVRYDALREGQVNINNGLTLGGFYPVHIAKGLKPLFNYDPGVGHYRISLTGETGEEYAASVKHLPKAGKDLHFTSVSILSDETQVLSLHDKIRFYNIIDITVDQIMTGDGYFKLAGTPDLGIPGFVPNDAVMLYTRNNLKNPVLEPLQGAIDCSSEVTYLLDGDSDRAQHITDGQLTIYGNIKVAPSVNEPGSKRDAFTMRGLLTKTVDATEIEVIKVDNRNKYKGTNFQYFRMGDKKLKIIDGKQTVSGNQWQALHFTCKPTADQKGMKEENNLNFEVTGNIQVNSDGIQMDNMNENDDDNGNSPFALWRMGFNFADKTLWGSAKILPMELGYASVKGGMLRTLMGPQGFYFGAQLSFSYNQIPFDGGLIVGYTGYDLQKETRPLLYKFRARGNDRPDFSQGLKGFYFIGQVPVVDNIDHDYGLIKIYMDAGLGVWLNCNFDNGGTYKLGGYGYFNMFGGISQPCKAGVDQDFYASVSGGYQNHRLVYNVCGQLNNELQLCFGSINLAAYLYANQDGKDAGFGEGPCSK